MARTKKPKDTPEAPKENTLLTALKFIRAAQNEVGQPYVKHCVLYEGHAYAFNGFISIGCAVQTQANIAPHTSRLIAALERCEGPSALTQLGDALQVSAGRLRALVPCLPLADIPPISADPPIAPLGAPVRDAIAAVAPLAAEGAAFPLLASVRLAPGVAVTTNRNVILEAWHGFDFPDIMIPKASIKELLRIDKPWKAFGFAANGSSATFHFEDDSWFKTQLYEDKFPKYAHQFERDSIQEPVPAHFFEALEALSPLVGNKRAVGFGPTAMVTAPSSGSEYEMSALPHGMVFNLDYLMLLKGRADTLDFGSSAMTMKGSAAAKPLVFYGKNIRGLIAPMNPEQFDGT